MKLPTQSKPILRNSTNIFLNNSTIKPSELSYDECMLECDNLQEPAKTFCKTMCN